MNDDDFYSAETPCRTGNPDDWFIDTDGKQYPDEPDVDPEELKILLTRRRHARESCINDCPVRLLCLDRAIEKRETHGTWGGYYPEELRSVIRLRIVQSFDAEEA